MADELYSLRNVSRALPETLKQYLEAQYHIWDEYLVAERRRLLDTPGVIFQPPYIEATPSYVAGKPYEELDLPPEVRDILVAAAKNRTTGIPITPYAHQAQALETFFRIDGPPAELAISTGTGSGKTESFLMPIVGSLALEKARRPDSFVLPGARAILLYPMNALVNDQVSRLRRLMGSAEVAAALRRRDGYAATFGFYTSRTPYPGNEERSRNKRDVAGWIDNFFGKYAGLENELEREGKWPRKDLAKFRDSFITDPADCELLTRQEMQARPPDVLITNYSMLEYMLLRPVDSPIFDKTTKWLAFDKENSLIVVLDEAHLYQGAQGSEVALLLRRLVSRLRISRDRVRFILTSASLAEHQVKEFAKELTGAPDAGRAIEVVPGKVEKPEPTTMLSAQEREAFAALDLSALHNAEHALAKATAMIASLAQGLGLPVPRESTSASDLQDACFSLLQGSRAHNELAARVMGRPTAFNALANELFGETVNATIALDGLLASMAFARRKSDGRVLLPSRAHLLFRGLAGVHACTNTACSERQDASQATLLGRLYEAPRRLCACGSRVYELLTHRDCGAAFLRGYIRPDDPTFLWHEPSTGALGHARHLHEIHLLVEHERAQDGNSNDVWLHAPSGRLALRPPGDLKGYLPLRKPIAAPVPISGRNVVTFDRKCPVCLGTWQQKNRPKIMDLVTKGEDPFAHLIAAQVRLQPATRATTVASPNAGRKTLLFSDGRQKAARLARDVPRVLELDAFRQTILLAANDLKALGKQPRLSDTSIYPAFVAAATRNNLAFFDGEDAGDIRKHEAQFRDHFGGRLENALDDEERWEPSPPQQFRAELMRLLGNRHYSLYALGLGFATPTKGATGDLQRAMSAFGLSADDVRVLSVLWIDKLLSDFSLFAKSKVKKIARVRASGHPITEAGSKTGFYGDQKKFLKDVLPAFNEIDRAFAKRLTTPGDSDELHLLEESLLCLEPALDHEWYRCNHCTYLAPVTWRGACAGCGKQAPRVVPPGGDRYLRARKDFWRTPVEHVLAGQQKPFTLAVEEHTAQLNYRDAGDVESTTETYERRFRDILVSEERSIDVLSCTTTMEVGIDIGSLIGVGLRNMPPSRHNYQQRAGRAGRRGSAVSTVVTFAQHNPHDAHLFENPEDLIAGPPRPAGLDVSNRALVERHAFAELIQEYFNSEIIRETKGNIFATLGGTLPFYNGDAEGTLSHLTDWLTGDASKETRHRLGKWIPPETQLSADKCARDLAQNLERLREVVGRGLAKDEEELIEFLFAHGVLPAYAFPRDLISLEIEEPTRKADTRERPQQGANIALSEYAPGRTVVVNKRTYRIGAVTASTMKDEVNRARALFVNPPQYFQCAACLNTTETTEGNENADCRVCRSAPMQRITVIQPQIVWPEGGKEVDELDDEQVFTDTTVAQLPIPSSDKAFGDDERFGQRARLKFGRQVPLVVVNRGLLVDGEPSGFDVCRDCGFVPLAGNPFPSSHERCYRVRSPRPSNKCTGGVAHVYLGYQFQTDVSLLHIPLAPPFVSNLQDPETRAPLQTAAYSLANALSICGASELGIDQRELQSGHRLRNTSEGAIVDIYVYDTLAGGAGYSRLVGQNFNSIFQATIARLEACECNSSCTHCLRTYGNRMSHTQLDRRLALDLARYALNDTVPKLAAAQEQRHALGPLLSMLQLDGWSIRSSPTFGAIVSCEGKQLNLALRPALFDPYSLPGNWSEAHTFSQFEVEKDLPSCLLAVPRK